MRKGSSESKTIQEGGVPFLREWGSPTEKGRERESSQSDLLNERRSYVKLTNGAQRS